MRRSTIALASAALVLIAGCRRIEPRQESRPPASEFANIGHTDAGRVKNPSSVRLIAISHELIR